MALTLHWGTVTAVTQRLEDIIRCEVDGKACISYPRQTGPVEVGDTVLINTQGLDLELGSGGFNILYANMTRGLGLKPPTSAHVMMLPYTSGQTATGCVEEESTLAEGLDGLPVVCCGLHSQLAPAVAGIGAGVRVAYVQIGGGALPVALSDSVRQLKSRRLLEATVAVAPCLEGDVQALTVASALAWAKAREFDERLLGIIAAARFRIVAVVIDKRALREKYGDAAAHPYHLAIGYLLQRYCGYLNHVNRCGDVMAESRGGREDRLLKESYADVYANGVWMTRAEHFQHALTSKELKIKPKSANISGLQLADLLGHPCRHDILMEFGHTTDAGGPFAVRLLEAVRGKFNAHLYDGRIKGYGKVLYPEK